MWQEHQRRPQQAAASIVGCIAGMYSMVRIEEVLAVVGVVDFFGISHRFPYFVVLQTLAMALGRFLAVQRAWIVAAHGLPEVGVPLGNSEFGTRNRLKHENRVYSSGKQL